MNVSALASLAMLAEHEEQKPHTQTAIIMRFVEYGEYDRVGRLIAEPILSTVGFLCRDDVKRYKKFNRCKDNESLFSETTRNVELKPCVVTVRPSGRPEARKAVTVAARFAYVDGILLIDSDSKLQAALPATHIATVNGVMTFAASPRKYVVTPL